MLGDDGRQCEPVDVVDLTGFEWKARIDDFVARRKNRDARPRVDVDVSEPERRQCPTRLAFRTSPARITVWPLLMSAPWRPMFCPGSAAA